MMSSDLLNNENQMITKKLLKKRLEFLFTDLGSRIGHQLGRVQVVAVQGCATRVPVPPGTGAQRLGEIQPNVDSVAHLLNGALRQQVDMLIVRVVVILGRFRERRARPLRQSYPRLQNRR